MQASAKGTSTFEPAPAGTHMATVVNLIDLGTQVTGFGDSRQVRVAFELLGKQREYTDKDGNDQTAPEVVGKDCGLSMNKKAFLRQVTDAALNTGSLDDDTAETVAIEESLGKNVLITVEHKTAKSSGNVYANVKSVTALPDGMTTDKVAESEILFFDFGSSATTDFEKLPEWLQNKINVTEEYKRFSEDAPTGDFDEREAPEHTDSDIIPDEDLPAGWSKG